MKKSSVAILGAGGFGKYHVREFSKLGAKVVAILGSTKENSLKTARELNREFGIETRPYDSLRELLENEDLDAVSICTPPNMHELQIKMCLEKDLNVICEKPFLQNCENNYETAKSLFDLSEKKGKILTVNTQWASIADYFIRYGFLSDLRKLSISMEPEKKGINMLRDHLPHTNSVLIKMIPNGKSDRIQFLEKTEDSITVKFEYFNNQKTCEVHYNLKSRTKKPGEIIFSLNEECFRRKIGPNYKQFFVSDKYRFEIKDPLKISIKSFLEACSGFVSPLVNKREILENILLEEQIIQEYILSP